MEKPPQPRVGKVCEEVFLEGLEPLSPNVEHEALGHLGGATGDGRLDVGGDGDHAGGSATVAAGAVSGDLGRGPDLAFLGGFGRVAGRCHLTQSMCACVCALLLKKSFFMINRDGFIYRPPVAAAAASSGGGPFFI